MTQYDFKSIWLPYNADFYRVAFSLLKDRDEAMDATQDLYIKLWNMKNMLDQVEHPKAFGSRLMKNLCLDRIRKRNSSPDTSSAITYELAGENGRESDSAMIGKEDIRMLEAAIDKLPPTQQQIIRLRFYEEKNFEEIASEMGLSQINARVLLSRARNRLKTLLKRKI